MNEMTGPVQVAFDKRGCRRLLEKHPSLGPSVARTLRQQAENDFFKTKTATRRKWQGRPLLECRVNDPSAGSVRVAFARQEGSITVAYITRTLVKKAFTQELENFLKGAQG